MNESRAAPVAAPVFVVFARAPVPGQVKTRLAAELGESSALAIYRALGQRTVNAVRRAVSMIQGARAVVYCTPPDSGDAMRAWLGSDLEILPQDGGDLGARMLAAIQQQLARGATSVVVVGTDCPELDAKLLVRACESLEDADVVLGPAVDGGYYLMATREGHAALFHDIPWSTADTLGATLRAAERARLRAVLLDTRADIDTAADWRAWLHRDGDARPADAM